MSIKYTVNKFINEENNKLVGLECTNGTNTSFIIDKRIPLVDGTSDASYVQKAYDLSREEIDEWVTSFSVTGMVFNPEDSTLSGEE